jgi:hypothetical protein
MRGLAVVEASPGGREIAKGIGLVVPLDPESHSGGIESVAAGHGLSSELKARSSARGTEFRWDAAVTELEHIYDGVANI